MGFGTIFKLTPSGDFSVIYNFVSTDGTNPNELLEVADGSFYGTVGQGRAGSDVKGTVFHITPAGDFTVLHTFHQDLFDPSGGLVLASDGDFYGLTAFGGSYGGGGVYKIDATGDFAIVDESGDDNALEPNGTLLEAFDGSLCGVTLNGGNVGRPGTIFKISLDGTFTSLHSSVFPEGYNYYGGLIQATDGEFYGTAKHGGANGVGTIYQVTPAGVLTTLHDFNNADGGDPVAQLIQGKDGNLYGTTSANGGLGGGTVFRVTLSGEFATIHNFNPDTDGGAPLAGVIQDDAGNLIGTTSTAGPDGFGTIYSIDPSASPTPVPSPTPAVVTLAATGINSTAVTFNGSVNPRGSDTTFHFDYGLSDSYGSTTTPADAGSGTTNLQVASTVTGLSPSTLYHFRISATNGGTANGADLTVTTAAATPTPPPTPTPSSSPSPTPTPTSTPSPSPSPSPSEQLLNISTRANVGTGDQIAIGGFIIVGSDSKKVLLRGIGPSLSSDGLTGLLADPTLQLIDQSGSTMASNDNWKDTQEAEIEATGAAPTNDLESAIIATLTPGAYTVFLQGKNNTTGIGLVEIYDLDVTAMSTLANISTRGLVGTGDDVLIGGAIVGASNGGGPSQMVMRAIGPSLPGVSDPLPDPTLELYDSNGTSLAFDDNWKDTQQIEIEATGLAPTDGRESAIETALPAGNYTVIVRGKNGATGVALVEIYNLGNSGNAALGARSQ